MKIKNILKVQYGTLKLEYSKVIKLLNIKKKNTNENFCQRIFQQNSVIFCHVHMFINY